MGVAWSECSGWVVEADGSCAVDQLQGRPVTPLTCSSCQRKIRSCGVMWSTHPQSPIESTGPNEVMSRRPRSRPAVSH